MMTKRVALGFIHSEIDDLNLNPFTLRVYLKLVRRSSTSGFTFQSAESIAKETEISLGRVKESLRELIKIRLIARLQKAKSGGGSSSKYYLLDRDEWLGKRPVSGDPDGSRDDPSEQSRRVIRRPDDGSRDDPSVYVDSNPQKESPKEGAKAPLFPSQLPRIKEPELPNNPIPEEWQRCSEFCSAWFDWISAKRESKKPSTARGMKTARNTLSTLGKGTAISTLERAAETPWVTIRAEYIREGEPNSGRSTKSGLDETSFGL